MRYPYFYYVDCKCIESHCICFVQLEAQYCWELTSSHQSSVITVSEWVLATLPHQIWWKIINSHPVCVSGELPTKTTTPSIRQWPHWLYPRQVLQLMLRHRSVDEKVLISTFPLKASGNMGETLSWAHVNVSKTRRVIDVSRMRTIKNLAKEGPLDPWSALVWFAGWECRFNWPMRHRSFIIWDSPFQLDDGVFSLKRTLMVTSFLKLSCIIIGEYPNMTQCALFGIYIGIG